MPSCSGCSRATSGLPGLLERLRVEPAWATIALNPRRSGTAYAIDGRQTWLVHNYLRPDEDDFDAVDRDWSLRTILGVDDDFDYELLSKEDWFGRRLIAERFRAGGCSWLAMPRTSGCPMPATG